MNTRNIHEASHKSRVDALANHLGRWSVQHMHETGSVLTHEDGRAIYVRTLSMEGRLEVRPSMPRDPHGAGYPMRWDDRRYGGPLPGATYDATRLDTPEGAARVARDVLRRVVTPLVAAWPAIVADVRQANDLISDTLETAREMARVVGKQLSVGDEQAARSGNSVSLYFEGGIARIHGKRVTFERLNSVSPEVALKVIALLTGKGA